MRQHYVTLCAHGNTVVTYMRENGKILVTFEQAVNKGFHSAVMQLNGELVSNEGFVPAELDYFQRFLQRNSSSIAEGVMEYA